MIRKGPSLKCGCMSFCFFLDMAAIKFQQYCETTCKQANRTKWFIAKISSVAKRHQAILLGILFNYFLPYLIMFYLFKQR